MGARLQQAVLDARRPLGLQEILRAVGLHAGQQTLAKRALRELVRSGALQRSGKRFSPPPTFTRVEHGQAAVAPGLRHGTPPRAFGPKRGAGAGGVQQRERAPWKPGTDRESRAPGLRGKGAPAPGVRLERGGGRPQAPRGKGAPERERRRPFVSEPRVSERSSGDGLGENVIGALHVHPDGFGFVHPRGAVGENVYIPAHEAARALDKDVVEVEVVPGRGGRTAGRIVRVVERMRENVVGIYHVRGRQAHVEPLDASMGPGIAVPPTQLAQPGDAVRVRLGVGRDLVEPGEGLFGEVTGSLGKPGEPSAEVLSIVFSQGFSDEFPPEAMDEADAVPLQVSEEQAKAENRRDLRHLPLVTIDGIDARDFDDAVYADRDGAGYRLWVAIADVSHYVKARSPLDAEALHRATSVYLPGRVLPMLPERLSNGICSLRPHEDRLCMVAEMWIGSDGALGEYEVYPGVMRSAARCTYEEVQDVLDGKDVPGRNEFKSQFQTLFELSRTLTRMRERRGAIDFDLPETRIVLDDDGYPVRMEKRERKSSHRLIEECMLAANEAVARYCQEENLPSVYRFHGEPDEEKLATFSALAEAHGFVLGQGGDIRSHELNAFLKKLEGHPEQPALNQMLLRSMMQAIYSAENVGHYGLGAEHYLHFTSPIRRYPDLLVHRVLKAHWATSKGRSETELERETERLEQMAEHCSERERAAMQAEREVKSFYATLMMKDRIGEEFDGTVTGIADFGFFVELSDVFVDGLCRAESVGFGAKVDPTVHQLVYPDGRRIRVGEKVRVRLISANVSRRQLEFEPLSIGDEEGRAEGEDEAPRRKPSRTPARRGAAAATGDRATTRKTAAVRGKPSRAPLPAPASKAPARKAKRSPAHEAPSKGRAAVQREAPFENEREALRSVRRELIASGESPHPGFDRLRAVAIAQGKLAPGGAGKGKGGARKGGKPSGRGGRSSAKSGGPKRKGRR